MFLLGCTIFNGELKIPRAVRFNILIRVHRVWYDVEPGKDVAVGFVIKTRGNTSDTKNRYDT